MPASKYSDSSTRERSPAWSKRKANEWWRPPEWFDVAYRIGEVIQVFDELTRAPLQYEVAAGLRTLPRLPAPEMREWVHDLVAQPRTVSFRLIDQRIVEAVHQDLPPDNDLMTLLFDYS